MREEVKLHLRKVQAQMPAESALLISANVNLYYCTGRFFRGYVWLPAEGEALYFVMRPQVYSARPDMTYIRKPEQIPDLLRDRGMKIPEAIGIEQDILSYSDAMRLMKLFPEARYFNATPCLRGARMVKTEYEISQMKIDGAKQAKVYSEVASLYRPGMTDIDLQIAIEGALRREGCLGYARVSGNLMEINMGSVLAGDNADTPSPYEFAMGGAGADPSLPGGADGTLISRGESVMVDMCGAFNAYQSDMTRVWSLGGLSEIALKAQECSMDILRSLERDARPGMEVCELYFKALDIAAGAGLKDYFMGHAQQSGFIGHGVGLELNEQPPVAPRCKVPLQAGMTLALEPKFVIPGVGALGVENTYAVREQGLENLTPLTEDVMPFRSI